MKNKIHPIWWVVGAALALTVAGGQKTMQSPREAASTGNKSALGTEPIPNLAAGLAGLDGHTDPASVATYETMLADIETVCLETREDVSLLAFRLVEEWEKLDFEYTHLEALRDIGSTAEDMGEGREVKCFDAYMEFRRGQKAMAEDIEQDQRTPSW